MILKALEDLHSWSRSVERLKDLAYAR